MDREVYERFKDAQNMLTHEYYKDYMIKTWSNGAKALIKAILEPLSKVERQVVGLRIAGFSYESIGQQLKLTKKQAERKFKKAKEKLYRI